jgi:hypothetical protein
LGSPGPAIGGFQRQDGPVFGFDTGAGLSGSVALSGTRSASGINGRRFPVLPHVLDEIELIG